MERSEALQIILAHWVLDYNSSGSVKTLYETLEENEVIAPMVVLFGTADPSEEEIRSFIIAHSELMIYLYEHRIDLITGKESMTELILNHLI